MRSDARSEIERIWALHPLMQHLSQRWATSRCFEGWTVGWNCHLTTLTAVAARALVQGGGRWIVSACNPATTHPDVVGYLRGLGMTVYTGEEGDRHAQVLAHRPDLVADTGFDLCSALLDRHPQPLRAALEITASGVARLTRRELPFPVLNINDGRLKPAVENRHGVGEGLWQALSLVTGQHPGGRRVVVVGYGPVGQGVAIYGKALGAAVEVVETDPIRRLCAHYDGFPTPTLGEALPRAAIVVTATGSRGVLGEGELRSLPAGCVVANVGHFGTEIDARALAEVAAPTPLSAHLTRCDRPQGGPFYLVTGGEPVNIVLNTGSPEPTLLHIALEGLSLEWLTRQELTPGHHVVPLALERELAELALTALGAPPPGAASPSTGG